MDADWLNEHAGLHREVESVRVVSESVRRGKHSHVATLEVQFRGSSDQHRLFLKRSVRSELPPRSETHWKRDLASYRTEARFYAEFYPSIVAASVPLVPVRFTAHSADQFLLLLDHADCSGLACVDRLDVHHAKLALRYLASLHAAACQVDGLLDRAAERLWPTGGWWELAKRGQQELEQATSVWPSVLHNFERELSTAGIDTHSERIVNLGARMVQHAGYIHRELVGDSAHGPKTLVHGDFKAANLLFGASGVTAFDWQWTGVGLGAMDVAYLLNTSVGIEALEDEQELIRVYYEALDERVGLQQYPLAAFERHCRLATLEYARILLSNFWKGMTPQSCAAKAANANCGLGYRSVAHVLRMVRVLDAGLAFVEHEQQQL